MPRPTESPAQALTRHEEEIAVLRGEIDALYRQFAGHTGVVDELLRSLCDAVDGVAAAILDPMTSSRTTKIKVQRSVLAGLRNQGEDQ